MAAAAVVPGRRSKGQRKSIRQARRGPREEGTHHGCSGAGARGSWAYVHALHLALGHGHDDGHDDGQSGHFIQWPITQLNRGRLSRSLDVGEAQVGPRDDAIVGGARRRC